MFKKLLLAIAVALPMSLSAQKFAIINTQQLMESMPDLKNVQEQVEASNKKYQAEFDNLKAEFEKKYADLQALDESTPPAIKERRMAELQELDNKITQFRETAVQDVQRQQAQLMAPIQEKVLKAIQAVGQEGGYTFVFENGMPLYSGTDVVDITSTVKARLGIQ